MCASNSIVTVCVSKKLTEVKQARPRILGMTLVAERPHDKYGSAIFIGDDLNEKSISVTAANHVEVITAELPDVVLHSVYKPPSEQFVLPPLGHRSLPQIVIRDFNSHNTIWGYDAQITKCSSCRMGRVEQPNTHQRCETTEIFQQCKMEKGYNPYLSLHLPELTTCMWSLF